MFSPRAAETRPESGGSCPVITWSNVVLPSPLRPTMPTRSPAEMPSETSLSSGRTPYAFETRSRLTRLATVHHMCPGDRPVRHEYDALVARRGQRAGHRAGVLGRLAQEDARRSGAGHEAAQCARVHALHDQLREVGTQVESRLLQVVVQGRGEVARVPAGQRSDDFVGR